MLTLIDAHVHVYACADVSALLDAAAAHFSAAAARSEASVWRGVLLLTETADDGWFESAARSANGCDFGAWRVAPAPDDPLSLHAQQDEIALRIVAGRQIVTAERIEVHALGARELIADGLSLDETISAVRATGALAVLPWGVGKWFGRRGRLVRARLEEDRELGVSDNGGRPWFWRDRLLIRANTAGHMVLRGSDPLPLPGQEARVGSFGCRLTGLPSGSVSAREILDRLAAAGQNLSLYGPNESLGGFLRNQLALRTHK